MIRDIRRNGAQPKDTMHKAGVALVTGMGVVIKDATTVELPKAETVANIYVATKERMDKLSLYLNDRASDSVIITLNKYAQAIRRMPNFAQYMSNTMKEDFNRWLVRLYQIK